MEDIKNIIESLLFVSETPLTIERLKDVLETVDTKAIRQALSELSDDYESHRSSILLKEVAGGFQIRTRPEYHDWIKRLLKPSPHRLSKAALETLSIIAYKQPIIRSDVEHLRGVDCGGVLRVLMEKKLIRTLGRKEIPGRPLIYATTKRFLEVFDLKDLKDLPTPKEIEAMGDLPFPEEGSPMPEEVGTPMETPMAKDSLPQEGQSEPSIEVNPPLDEISPTPEEKSVPQNDRGDTLNVEGTGPSEDAEDGKLQKEEMKNPSSD